MPTSTPTSQPDAPSPEVAPQSPPESLPESPALKKKSGSGVLRISLERRGGKVKIHARSKQLRGFLAESRPEGAETTKKWRIHNGMKVRLSDGSTPAEAEAFIVSHGVAQAAEQSGFIIGQIDIAEMWCGSLPNLSFLRLLQLEEGVEVSFRTMASREKLEDWMTKSKTGIANFYKSYIKDANFNVEITTTEIV